MILRAEVIDKKEKKKKKQLSKCEHFSVEITICEGVPK